MKLSTIALGLVVALFIVGCAGSNDNMQKDTMMKKDRPMNIDKNNVSDTSKELPDQTDPTLIEGNLEKNDFKN